MTLGSTQDAPAGGANSMKAAEHLTAIDFLIPFFKMIEAGNGRAVTG